MRDFNDALRGFLIGGIGLLAISGLFIAADGDTAVLIGYAIAAAATMLLLVALTGYGVRAGILAAKQLEQAEDERGDSQ